jgi:hypothetical protein
MPKCSTEYVLLEAPLTLAELARHLATRKNFLLHPCGGSVVRALEVVARPYGYEVSFDAEEEVARLQHSGSAQACLCEGAASHLSATQQLKLLLRR